MDFYVYNQNVPLGCEKLGTDGKRILRNCTMRKVNNFLRDNKQFINYSVYRFTNFYDNNTFKLVCNK
jgi:hypothetical protein